MMTPHDKMTLIKSLQKALEAAEMIPTTTSCLDCGFYQKGECLKWKSQIPLDAIQDGCEQWVLNPLTPPF